MSIFDPLAFNQIENKRGGRSIGYLLIVKLIMVMEGSKSIDRREQIFENLCKKQKENKRTSKQANNRILARPIRSESRPKGMANPTKKAVEVAIRKPVNVEERLR